MLEIPGVLNEAQLEKVQTGIATISAIHEPYKSRRGDRIATFAAALARRFELSPVEIGELKLAAQVHDVGMQSVPSDTLRKQEGLDAEDWSLIKQHPTVSARIIADIPPLENLDT